MYIRNVKQKISAIVLLFAFLGILAHDMMPHHHHDGNNSVALHVEQHDHEDCHSNHDNDLTVEFEEEEICEAENHNCPHELHNCTIQVYDASRSVSSEQSSKKKVQQNLFVSSYTANLPTTSKLKHLLPEGILHTENIYLSNSSLRAPPVKA